jgi:hypothetical protein
MTADELRKWLEEVPGNQEVWVANETDPALLWRMPEIYIVARPTNDRAIK